jgi:hypothetical protein
MNEEIMKVGYGSELLTIARNLERNRFKAILAKNGEDARRKALELIPQHSTIGVANSVTVRQIGLLESLKQRGDTLVDPISMIYDLKTDFDETKMLGLMRKSLDTDVFVSGTNAITRDGKLVNIDGTGNRVAGIVWARGKVLVFVSRNKIAYDVDQAIQRIKMIVPILAVRRQLALPCAKAGKCIDCFVPQRACNITMILEKCPGRTDLTVILVDEDLGMGFDPTWPVERIEHIKRRYEQFDGPYNSKTHRDIGR